MWYAVESLQSLTQECKRSERWCIHFLSTVYHVYEHLATDGIYSDINTCYYFVCRKEFCELCLVKERQTDKVYVCKKFLKKDGKKVRKAAKNEIMILKMYGLIQNVSSKLWVWVWEKQEETDRERDSKRVRHRLTDGGRKTKERISREWDRQRWREKRKIENRRCMEK